MCQRAKNSTSNLNPKKVPNGEAEAKEVAESGKDYLESQRLFKRQSRSRPTHLSRSRPLSTLACSIFRLSNLDLSPNGRPARSPLESIAQSRGTAPSDRCFHRRAKVNYTAGIRSEAFGDDIVGCIDMSRGGLSFKTQNHYIPTTIVGIAVPFYRQAPDAPAIFVPAKFMNFARPPNSDLFRDGVTFLREGTRSSFDWIELVERICSVGPTYSSRSLIRKGLFFEELPFLNLVEQVFGGRGFRSSASKLTNYK